VNKLIPLFISMFLFSPSLTLAGVTPSKIGSDSRITNVKYDPNNVVKISTKVGFATLIQLEEGERSAPQAGIGDDKAWGVGSVENNIFIKPIAYNPRTNLIITTNKGRTYTFDLSISNKPLYVVKFEYEKKKEVDVVIEKKNSCLEGPINLDYLKWGDEGLTPGKMWDDGKFTCLVFEDKIELPLVYQISLDGEESLVNYHIEDGKAGETIVVVHSISPEFRLRLGESVLGIESPSLSKRFRKTNNKPNVRFKGFDNE
jgi:type IV secretion system protein VirB9